MTNQQYNFCLSGKDNLEMCLKTLKNKKSIMQLEFCRFWIANKYKIEIEREHFDIINDYVEKHAASIAIYWNKKLAKQ